MEKLDLNKLRRQKIILKMVMTRPIKEIAPVIVVEAEEEVLGKYYEYIHENNLDANHIQSLYSFLDRK